MADVYYDAGRRVRNGAGDKARLATTVTEPEEGDWGAWTAIVSGNNIGTILSDTPPPGAGEGRWLQIDVEGGPSAVGVKPYIDVYAINWAYGSVSILALRSYVYRKRLYFIAGTAEAEYNNRVLILDSNGAWSRFEGLYLNAVLMFKGLLLGLSASTAYIRQIEVEGQLNDGSTAIEAYVETGMVDFGQGRFRLERINLDSNAGTSSVALYYKKQGDTSWTLLDTLEFTTDERKEISAPFGTVSKKFEFKILNNTANQRMNVGILEFKGQAASGEIN